MTINDMLPTIPGLYQVDDQGQPALTGTRCGGCGTYYFPVALGCRNPDCDATDLTEVPFGRRGVLFSYTVQQYRPPAMFQVDDWKPYPLGLVDVTENVRIMAIIDTEAFDELTIGMPVELVIDRLFTDDEGQAHSVFKYRPVKEGDN